MQLPSPNPKVNLLFSKETIMLGRSETFGIYWRGGFFFHGVQRDAFLAVLERKLLTEMTLIPS